MHSAQNLGDDRIFEVTRSEIRRMYPNAVITIAANDPDSWLKYSEDIVVLPSMVTWVKRWKNGGWQLEKGLVFYYSIMLLLVSYMYKLNIKVYFGSKEIRQLLSAYYYCDVLFACGGGNIYSTSNHSWGLIWELLMFGFGSFIRKPVYLLPQSLGPIHGRVQKKITQIFLNQVQNIYIRDKNSAELLTNLKVKTKHSIVPDLAFRVKPSPKSHEETKKLKFGFTIINLDNALVPTVKQELYETTIEGLIKRLNKRYNASIILIVQCYGPTFAQDDRIVSKRIYGNLLSEIDSLSIADDVDSGRTAQDLISDLDIMIGTRMHSGIFALNACVPTLLLNYQPKSYALMEMFGLEKYCISMEKFDPDLIYPVLCELIDERNSIKEIIENSLRAIADAQECWLDKLMI